jgi:hypothetical protein
MSWPVAILLAYGVVMIAVVLGAAINALLNARRDDNDWPDGGFL